MLLFDYRKDEAANRPKVEFVPKSLADLNIEGVSDGVNGINQHNFNSDSDIYRNVSFGQPFKKPPPVKTIPTHALKPDPFDPWSFYQGIFLWFWLFFILFILRVKKIDWPVD